MQIFDVKKKAPKWLQNWIWEGLGLRLGRICDGLGNLLGTFANFLAVFWTFKIQFFSGIGPRWAPRGLLNRFWVDLGKDWHGFLEHLGGFGEDFPCWKSTIARHNCDFDLKENASDETVRRDSSAHLRTQHRVTRTHLWQTGNLFSCKNFSPCFSERF